jgi:hydroxymethylpyrimidine/phosphomethylpyrimidine kinase
MIPVALTIAGSDPSGGAGLQADLKTFHQRGVYGEAAVTLITVQNTRGVERVEVLDPELLAAQVRAVIADIPPQAAKTGALGSRAMVEMVAALAAEFGFPLVVDPVMISKHGAPLMSPDAAQAMAERLLPRAFLITPNLHEAAALVGFAVEDEASMTRAAEKLAAMGAANVLVKGGHLRGSAVDLLRLESGEVRTYSAYRWRKARR